MTTATARLRAITWVAIVSASVAACGEAGSDARAAARSVARPQPMRIDRRREPLVDVDPATWSRLVAMFEPRVIRNGVTFTSPSVCLHSLRLRGMQAKFADDVLGDSDAVLSSLLDTERGRAVFHSRIASKTRFGARFRPPSLLPQASTGADESHIDQVLAGLLELGVPLASPLHLDGDRLQLRDVVDDTIANFSIDEPELQWTAVSLVLALPPCRTWTNKFHETFTFDDLVRRLLERHPSAGSCAGTHTLHTLVLIARVHDGHPILGAEVEAELRQGLRHRLERILANQRPDGAWDMNWCAEGPHDEKLDHSPETLALVTGHLGEALLMLPEEFEVPAAPLTAAGTWLYRYLRDNLTPELLSHAYCPMTHAAVTVQQLRR